MERVIEINKFKNSNGRRPISRGELGSIVSSHLGNLWGMAIMGSKIGGGTSSTKPRKFARAKRRMSRSFRNQNRR